MSFVRLDEKIANYDSPNGQTFRLLVKQSELVLRSEDVKSYDLIPRSVCRCDAIRIRTFEQFHLADQIPGDGRVFTQKSERRTPL